MKTYYVVGRADIPSIAVVEGQIVDRRWVHVKTESSNRYFFLKHCHETREAAEAHVQKLIGKKIVALEKQIDKLKKMQK